MKTKQIYHLKIHLNIPFWLTYSKSHACDIYVTVLVGQSISFLSFTGHLPTANTDWLIWSSFWRMYWHVKGLNLIIFNILASKIDCIHLSTDSKRFFSHSGAFEHCVQFLKSVKFLLSITTSKLIEQCCLYKNKANRHKSHTISTINVFSNCTLRLYSQTIILNHTLKLYFQTVL